MAVKGGEAMGGQKQPYAQHPILGHQHGDHQQNTFLV